MSTIQAKETEHSCDQPTGRDHVLRFVGNPHLSRQEYTLFRLGRRHLRVKLCARCPYTPRDLADHYDPEASLHVCAKCDSGQAASTTPNPLRTNRRKPCVAVLNVFGTAQPIVARSVRESSDSSGTIPGEPLSVRKSAPTASGSVERTTAAGYVDCRPPETDRGEVLAAIFRNSGSPSKEVAQ